MNSPPPAPRFPLGVVIGVAVLALVGLAMLSYSIITLLDQNGPASENVGEAASATALPVAQLPSQVVFIPTTTPQPTHEPTAPPTESAPQPTSDPAAGQPVLTVSLPANVRSGPGLNYPVIGGLNVGETPPVLGRDAGAQWFVISFAGGQAWISSLVATFGGDLNSLPVIAAPPPPAPTTTPSPLPPTATPPPAATATPAGYFSRGVRGDYFRVRNTVVGVNQQVWFEFQVTNTSAAPVSFSLLAAHTDNGPNAESWNNETLRPGQVLPWEDWIKFSTPGTYQVYLGICYANRDDCLFNRVAWDRLSASVTVTVQ